MAENDERQALRQRLDELEVRITRACAKAGRQRNEITVVAVTKTTTAEIAGLLPELGYSDLGESRPQELARKATALADRGIRWHMIGHLQTNKIVPTIDIATLIHSVDRLRLIEELARRQRPVKILLEVNASREANKHGFAPDEVPGIVEKLKQFPNLQLEGLMTMAAYTDDPEAARATFREVRALRDAMGLKELSMGMSHDLEVAIEEGTTIIRPGSALFSV